MSRAPDAPGRLGTALLLLPAGLSALLLAAHFLRGGHLLVVALVLAMLPLLAVRQRWSMRVLQAVLVLAAVEWLSTLGKLVRIRMTLGLPYGRMALILGAVAALAAAAALLFESRRLRARYPE